MPSLGNNLGANGTRLKWYSIKMLNRIPQVELERKLNDIGRLYAAIKRETRIEEGQLWDSLFGDHQLLQESIARHEEEEVLAGNVPLLKPRGEKDEPPPYSEVYRQFIIYKARASVKIFGVDKAPRLPKYKDLYRRMKAPKQNNTRNINALLDKFNAQNERNQKIIAALRAPGIEYNELDDVEESESRRTSIRWGGGGGGAAGRPRKLTNGDVMATLANNPQHEDILTSRRNVEDSMSHRRKMEEDVNKSRHAAGNQDGTAMVNVSGVKSTDLESQHETSQTEQSFLPPVFLTIPTAQLESEARPPEGERTGRKNVHRLKLPKVDE